MCTFALCLPFEYSESAPRFTLRVLSVLSQLKKTYSECLEIESIFSLLRELEVKLCELGEPGSKNVGTLVSLGAWGALFFEVSQRRNVVFDSDILYDKILLFERDWVTR